MLDLLGGAAESFLLWIFGQSGLSDSQIRNAFRELVEVIIALVHWLDTLFQDELDCWRDVRPEITTGAQAIGDTSFNTNAAVTRITDLIIPNSLSWLDGKTHRWVNSKYDWQLQTFWNNFNQLLPWEREMKRWRREWVDPQLSTDLGYREFLQGWPQAQWFRWKGYFDRPSTFAAWVVPHIARPLVEYYGQDAHTPLRDDLVAEIIDSSPDLFRHVERAALKVLQSPYP